MKGILRNIILGLWCLLTAVFGYCQEKTTPSQIIQQLSEKGKALGRNYFYTNIPGTHIYMRLVNNNRYGYGGIVNHWSNGVELVFQEYYNQDKEAIAKNYASNFEYGSHRSDTVINGKAAILITGASPNGVYSQVLIVISEQRQATAMMHYSNKIPEEEKEIFQTMLFSLELHPEAAIDEKTAMNLAPFTLDLAKANDLTELNKQFASEQSKWNKTPPLPWKFYGIIEGSYEFTNGGLDPDDENTSTAIIKYALKQDFKRDAEAFLQSSLLTYNLDHDRYERSAVEEIMINDQKVLMKLFIEKGEEKEVYKSLKIMYIYEDGDKYTMLLFDLKYQSNPYIKQYTTRQAQNFASALQPRILE